MQTPEPTFYVKHYETSEKPFAKSENVERG